MRRIAAWFRSHLLTTGFLVLIGCAVGAHFFADWRAEVRWQHYCTEARARGVKLTLAEFAPPEIPDAENFAALPMMRAAFGGGTQTAFKLPRSSGEGPPHYNYKKGERIDFKAWAEFFRDAGFISETTNSPPGDVLLALEHYAPQFKEWSEWRSRPQCQFPIQLDANGFMKPPSFYLFSNAARIFTLRMRAHLAVGDSPSALADFQDALQIHRAFGNATTLIAVVIRMGLLSIVCSQLGESLEHPAWTDHELRQIQNDLAAVGVSKMFMEGFAAERIGCNMLYERLVHSCAERTQLTAFAMNPSPAWWQTTGCMLIPSRVFRDNQLRQNQLFDEQQAKAEAGDVDFRTGLQAHSQMGKFDSLVDDQYFFLFYLFADAIVGVSENGVTLQNRLAQMRIAAALERFRLDRGHFPERLAELTPKFIAEVPLDSFSRQPMIYRRQEGGTFLLYGVGKNGKDDGGMPDAMGADGSGRDDIWLYAPPAR